MITENSFDYTLFNVPHVLVNSISISALTSGTPLALGVNAFQHDVAGAYNLRPTAMQDSQPGDPMWFVTEHGDNQSVDVIKMSNLLY